MTHFDISDMLNAVTEPLGSKVSESIAATFVEEMMGEPFTGTWDELYKSRAERATASDAVMIRDAVAKLRIADEARKRFNAQNAEDREPLPLTGLADLLAADLPPEQFIVDGVLHRGGNVMFTAARKTGKSTVAGNLIRSLVDGDAFMDAFDVTEARKVALIDLELTPATLQRWLREQGIRNVDALTVVPLRGRVGAFNILDKATRAELAKELRGHDVLILDPLRPLADALGLNEHTEMGRLLEAFDALKAEAGISEGIVVHHHGHGSDRARGDSRLEDWPDAVWRLQRDNLDDPHALRTFSAFGRDVAVDMGALRLDGRRLTFTGDVPAAKADRWTDRIVEYLTGNGESNTATIRDALAMNKDGAAAIFLTAVDSGRVSVRQAGPSKVYYLPGEDEEKPF